MITVTESAYAAERMKLIEIVQSPGRIERSTGGSLPYFEIVLPYGCGIRGVVTRFRREREAYIESFSVPDNLRKNGIGHRLLSMFVVAARDEGAVTMYGDVISKPMLKTMAHVVGCLSLTFTEIPVRYPNGRSKRIQVPFETLVDDFRPLRVHADISSVDISGWERPVR